MSLPFAVSEMNLEVVIRLPLTDFCTMASTCRYFSDLMETAWAARITGEFGSVLKWKPHCESYRQQYCRLRRAEHPERSILDGRLDELVCFHKRGRLKLGQFYINSAAGNGYTDILHWLEPLGFLPNQRGADRAAGNGQIEVLDWLETKEILPTSIGMDWACGDFSRGGHINVLEWGEKRGIHATVNGASMAWHYSHDAVLEWLGVRNIKPTPVSFVVAPNNS